MLLPKRIWKDIPGYEGKYQVSNTGQVRTLNYNRTGKTKILKQSKQSTGYYIVNLCKNGKNKPCTVHRLVAQAFIPNPNNLPQVNHKDENKTNNVVWNLEWCTAKYNINYGTHNENSAQSRKGENCCWYGKLSKEHPRATPILMFTLDGQFVKRFDCIVDAYEYLGKKRTNANITQCLTGRASTAYGYIFKYGTSTERASKTKRENKKQQQLQQLIQLTLDIYNKCNNKK